MATKPKLVTIAVKNPKSGVEHLAEVDGDLLTRVHSGDPMPAGTKAIDGRDVSGFIWTGRNFVR